MRDEQRGDLKQFSVLSCLPPIRTVNCQSLSDKVNPDNSSPRTHRRTTIIQNTSDRHTITLLSSLLKLNRQLLSFFFLHEEACKIREINHIDKPDKLHLAGRVNRVPGHAVRSEAERRGGRREEERERERDGEGVRASGEAEARRCCVADSPAFLRIQTDCTREVAPRLTRYKTIQSTTPFSTNHNQPSKQNQFKRGHTIGILGCR